MAFDLKDLVFSLGTIEVSPPQAVLKLEEENGQVLAEVVFDCGRTNGTAGEVYVSGEEARNELKKALRKMLEQL